MFCSIKDKIPITLKSNVAYKFKCPHCASEYIGKTDRNLITRLKEHASIPTSTDISCNKSAIFAHLNSCVPFSMCVNDISVHDFDDFILATVVDNTEILDYNKDWLELCFLTPCLLKRTNQFQITVIRLAKN